MDRMTINNNILSKVSLSIKSVLMWWRRLVYRPVVKWRVNNWVLSSSLGLNKIVINSIKDHMLESKIFITLHSTLVWWGWLIYWPVIERWINNWVFRGSLNICQLINSNSHFISKMMSVHIIFHQNWVHKNRFTLYLCKFYRSRFLFNLLLWRWTWLFC